MAMTTNEQNTVRIDAVEKRMDKYDEILSMLKDTVVELKTRSESNYRWLTGCIAVSCAVIGALVGHLVH